MKMDFNTSVPHHGPFSQTNESLSTIETRLMTASPSSSILSSESSEFKTLKLFLYFVILTFSSVGNGLVFYLISCNRRLRQASSNMLLLNLSACDLLTPLLSIPFDLVLEERGYMWPYGMLLCRVLWPAATLTATASALTLAAISLDRYRLLMHPFTPRLTKKQIKFLIISIHLLSLSIIVPYINFLKLQDRQCLEQWPELGYRQAYTLVLFMAQYALPLIFMTTVYALALVRLYSVTSNATQMRVTTESQDSRNASNSARKVSVCSQKVSGCSRKVSVVSRKVSTSSQFASEVNNSSSGSSRGARIRRLSSRMAYNMKHGCELESNVRVTKMFIAIVVIFAIFMLPNQVVWLWIDFGGGQQHIRLNTIKIICWLFTYTNCVCNPCIFIIFFKDFRTEIVALPKRLCKRRKFSLHISQPSGTVTEYSKYNPPTSPVSILSTVNENENSEVTTVRDTCT